MPGWRNRRSIGGDKNLKTKSFCYQCQETAKFKELSADEKENLKQVFLENAKTIGVPATENEDIRSFLRM